MNAFSRTWMSYLLAASLMGCATGGDIDLLESELRVQEETISNLQYQLATANEDLRVARAEADLLRGQLADTGRPPAILPEQADALFRVQNIQLHKYMTGGLDKDGQPGDEALAVLLTPQDQDGELLKVTGGIHVDVFDMSLPPQEQNIGSWDITPEEAQQAWHAGFFGSGFMLELPFVTPPQSGSLTVHAKLATADGREFHTTQQVRVAPPETEQIARDPRSSRQPPPRLAPATEGPVVPAPDEFEDFEDSSVAPSGYQSQRPASVPTSNRWQEHDRPTWR